MNSNTRYALAGLQAGMSGALGLLCWMLLQARLFGKSIWWAPNVLASVFYGDASLKFGFGRYSCAGVALILFVGGALGIAFGLVWRERPSGLPLLLAGLLLAVFSYYALVNGIWRELSPAGALYAPNRQMLVGHLIFGVLLSTYSRFRVPSPPQ